jgi:sterol desaturase/sphingolipid hydroxylase (fatty acid hydroxylase superfamily)
VVLANQLLVLVPLQYFAYDAHVWMGNSTSLQLPSLLEVLRCMAICLAAEEIVFYYSHRALHYGPLYRYVHKIHHGRLGCVSLVVCAARFLF